MVESTINELHGYKPILLNKTATEKQIAIIEGNNGITPKIKKGGQGVLVAVVVLMQSSRQNPKYDT